MDPARLYGWQDRGTLEPGSPPSIYTYLSISELLSQSHRTATASHTLKPNHLCVFRVCSVCSVCVLCAYATGMRADINVINMDELRIHRPEVASDLPSGASRWIQRASGYVLTICKGVVTFREGVATVRERLACPPFYTKTRVYCQDRLGTNIL